MDIDDIASLLLDPKDPLSRAWGMVADGNPWAAEAEIAFYLKMKVRAYVAGRRPVADVISDLAPKIRFNCAALLAEAARQTGHIRGAVATIQALFSLPREPRTLDWATALAQSQYTDVHRSMAATLAEWASEKHESLREIEGCELLNQVVGEELTEWLARPDEYLREQGNNRCLAAYLTSLPPTASSADTQELRSWLLSEVGTVGVAERYHLARSLAHHDAARGNNTEVHRLITLLAGSNPPTPDSPGFQDPSLDCEIVADLVLLWLEHAGISLEQREAVTSCMTRFLDDLPDRGNLYRVRLLDLWVDWLGAGIESQRAVDPNQDPVFATMISIDTPAPLAAVSLQGPAAGAGGCHSPVTWPAPPGNRPEDWWRKMESIRACLDKGARVDDIQFTVAGAFNSADLALPSVEDALESNDVTPPLTDATAQMHLDGDELIKMLGRCRTAPNRSVVLLRFQPTPKRVVISAVELDARGCLRIRHAPGGGVAISPETFRASADAFAKTSSSGFDLCSIPGATHLNSLLASKLAEALHGFLDWTDKQLSDAVSTLLRECGDRPDVLLCTTGWTQGLLLDLLTIDDGHRKQPLIHYAGSLRWVPGLALQMRLNDAASELQSTSSWAADLGACAYLPRLERDEEGGYHREAPGGGQALGPDYLVYRCWPPEGGVGGPVVAGRDAKAGAVRDMADGRCRFLLLLAHGCLDRGAAVLWDELLDHLGPKPTLEALIMVSCDMGRLERGYGFTMTSHSLLTRLLTQGQVGSVVAFRYQVPDLPGVHVALDLLTPFLGPNGLSCGQADLTWSRKQLLCRVFPNPTESACKACSEVDCGSDEEVVQLLHRWVAAVSVVYSGYPSDGVG